MDFMDRARDFVTGLPETVQGLGVFLVSLIPFVEGEGAAIIGVVAGVLPWLAIGAAILGNVLVVGLLVYAADGIRGGIVRRRAARQAQPGPAAPQHAPAAPSQLRERFERWGVPGLSLVGPWFLIPGHVMAPAMVSFGAAKGYVMLWQIVSIVLYTAVFGMAVAGLLGAWWGIPG